MLRAAKGNLLLARRRRALDLQTSISPLLQRPTLAFSSRPKVEVLRTAGEKLLAASRVSGVVPDRALALRMKTTNNSLKSKRSLFRFRKRKRGGS